LQTRTFTDRSAHGFTLVEVMMAALILTVGFMGLVQAVTISSGMMDTARRQTLAAQILNHEIESLRFASWATVSNLPTAQTAIGAAWSNSTNYSIGDSATTGGKWYRCIQANTGQSPTNTTYWKLDTPPYANALSSAGFAYGASYSLSRTITSPDPLKNLCEIQFKVTWVVTTSRRDSGGALLTFTYTRSSVAYFGKYGLNLTYQRS
jgi:prepilin-type N-terminal cleavage/methylation domain-containing protein